jgi:hypothetical protein
MEKWVSGLFASTLILLPEMAFAACANTIAVLDGGGVSRTFCRGTDGSNYIAAQNIADVAGVNIAGVTASSALLVDVSKSAALTTPFAVSITPSSVSILNSPLAVSISNTPLGVSVTNVHAVTVPNPVTVTGTVVATVPNPTTVAGTITVNNATFAVTVPNPTTVNLLGHAGAAMDLVGQNAAQPANSLLTGCEFNTAPTTITSGNASPIQCDTSGNALVKVNTALPAGANTLGSVSVLNATIAVTVPNPTTVVVSTLPNPTTVVVSTLPNPVTITGAIGGTVAVSSVPNPTTVAQGTGNGTNTSSWLMENGCAGQTIANTLYKAFSITAATNTSIIAASSGKQVYICSINIVTALSNNIAMIEGTTTTSNCDGAQAGMAGGTTAALGWNIAANGGLTLGGGSGIVSRTATSGHAVCLATGTATTVAGGLTYAQF